MPILKPRRVATDCRSLRQRLDRECEEHKRTGLHADSQPHAIRQGKDTKATQSYPTEIVEIIHLAHEEDIRERWGSLALRLPEPDALAERFSALVPLGISKQGDGGRI